MEKKKPNRFYFLIYLLPVIVLIILVTIPRFNIIGEGQEPVGRIDKSVEADMDKPKIARFLDELSAEELEQEEDIMIESRIPIYPGAKRVSLEEGRSILEAVFYTTKDSVEEVFKWYEKNLNIYENRIMLVDFTRDGVRTVTLTMPDEPKELIEIKRPFMGIDETGITLTTFHFYTSSQPRWIGVDEELSSEESTDDHEETSQVDGTST